MTRRTATGPAAAAPVAGATGLDAWWSIDAATLLARLGSRRDGLEDATAAALLATHGPNTVDDRRELGALRLLARQFSSPLVLILVLAALLSLGLRDWTEAGIILAIVAGSTLLGFLQEYRATHAMAALRRRLALTARVRRGGVESTVPTAVLVPGDIVLLSAGNLVPADGVVLEALDFLVTEAALTGEPFPVEKRPGIAPADAPLAARRHCVFLGSSVRSGTATVLVVATGRGTAYGGVAAALRAAPPENEFSRGLRDFGRLLLRVMLLTVAFVLVVNALLGREPVESLMFAVALAVGLSPELLPAIVSVTLSRGARRMAARGVVVRRLEAIENLGSMDVLCTDKTGTLTTGRVELDAAVDASGQPSTTVLRLAYLNAALETGIANPLDVALVAAGEAAGLAVGDVAKVDEIPYDFIRRRLTIVIADPAGPGRHLIITKGAVTEVLGCCTQVRRNGDVMPLDGTQRDALADIVRARGEQGFRVLAVAARDSAPRPDYGHDDESGLVLEGLLAFLDPPKPQASRTLADLGALGVRTCVVTGDNRHVAAHVAGLVGLDPARLLTGAEIARLDDAALAHRAADTALFAEVDPQQKERIVRALRAGGSVVGYLGDGINDAPPLHVADVGISVDGAVDVARDTADVVLLQGDLDVLRVGVEEGRRTFANTLKYIGITTSANFGNMTSMALATPLLPFLPLAAKQILLNNFLSDLPSIAVSTDNVDAEQVRRPQRWDMREVRRFMIVFGLVSSAFDLLTFALLHQVFGAGEALFQTTWFTVSLLTELAVVLVLRTRAPAWRSLPGRLLAWTTVAVGAIAVALPFLPPVARPFGLVPLPPVVLATALLVVTGYILCTEWAKHRLYGSSRA